MASRSRRARGPVSSVQALAANPENPRKAWTAEKKEAFKKSLLQFGDLSGIIFNRTTRQLVGGHKRVEEFKEDASPSMDITQTLEKPDESGTIAYGFVVLSSGVRFAYREVEWTETLEKAANLAANQWSAEWDWEGVSSFLKDLEAEGFVMDVTGFDTSELEPLLAADWNPTTKTDMPAPSGEGAKTGATETSSSTHNVTLSAEAFEALVTYMTANGLETHSAAVLRLLAAVAPDPDAEE